MHALINSVCIVLTGRDDDLSDDKIWTSLIAFVGRYMLTHYPGLVVPPICIEDICKEMRVE